MRLLVEIFIIGGLIYLGWEQPFKEQLDQVRAKVTAKQAQVAPQELTRRPAPAPRIAPDMIHDPSVPRGAWRLDPNHRSTLDAPAHGSPSPHY
ncbi:MAG: hypothetical protein DME99_00760 [Verrucomicrobia bacterium]|nr:MAG: hypothetical protein DME99_00760 [Verrucomicrobiota bacterium]